MSAVFEAPRWLRDVVRFLPLKSQFVLSGNVRDLQAVEVQPGTVGPQSLVEALAGSLRQAGYAHVVLFDPVAGISVAQGPGVAPDRADGVLRALGLTPSQGQASAGLDVLGDVLERIVSAAQEPHALVVDFAAQLVARPEALSAAEHTFFTRALVASHRARAKPVGPDRKAMYPTVVWLVEKEGDLPDWLVVGNPRLRHVPVARPDPIARSALAAGLLRPLDGWNALSTDEQRRTVDTFVEHTDGLLLLDLRAVATLARVEGLTVAHIGDAVKRYKLGVTEDPWRRIDPVKIRGADAFMAGRIKGQVHAVTHMLDVVKRAMTGVGGARRGNRPRGVAFLAGPTGVGKTELAKTITQLLFGDEGAYIRFDMSEFSAEHADQRLTGAPPGYIGYDVGGELTNAVRERPFSVVLFDEIEKAHPRVLDKFLQILDDGVLTSGRGDRVYFSEALIVFTSNLGIYTTTESGARQANVDASEPYEAIQHKVLDEIRRHFKLVLNRPEILNRIGENIIVFDFIRPDVAAQIFEQMVGAIETDLAAQGFQVGLDATARDVLRHVCLSDLSNGGRGIRNQLEAHLLNPLSRQLFDVGARPGEAFELRSNGAQLQLVRA